MESFYRGPHFPIKDNDSLEKSKDKRDEIRKQGDLGNECFKVFVYKIQIGSS